MIYKLIDFNSMTTCLGVFYAKKGTACIVPLQFSVVVSLEFFAHSSMISSIPI